MRFLFCLFLIACQHKDKPAIEVTQTTQAYGLGSYTDLEITYSAKSPTCEISWTAMRQRDKSSPQHVSLQFRQVSFPCVESFEQLKPYHEAILTQLFKEFSPQTVKGVSTGGLKTLNPTGEWNEIVAKGSILMPEWQDYRQNYPKHKSQLSTNSLLELLIKQYAPHAEFKQMFLGHKVNLELEGVEKVFTDTVGKERVLTDAGVMWWKAQ